jgi:hypothetical protein
MKRSDRIMMDGLRAKLAEVTQEHKLMREGLLWIADQFCDRTKPDHRRTKACRESGDCITEWCLPCYAEAVLEHVADRPDRAKEGAASLVAKLMEERNVARKRESNCADALSAMSLERDEARNALMAALEWIDAEDGRKWSATDQAEFDRLTRIANGEA